MSSYSCMGTAALKSRTLKRLEKLYFLPNSVYCAEVTSSCNTSRWASNGLFFQALMRQYRMRARDDMAGESSFTGCQNKVFELNGEKRDRIRGELFSDTGIEVPAGCQVIFFCLLRAGCMIHLFARRVRQGKHNNASALCCVICGLFFQAVPFTFQNNLFLSRPGRFDLLSQLLLHLLTAKSMLRCLQVASKKMSGIPMKNVLHQPVFR